MRFYCINGTSVWSVWCFAVLSFFLSRSALSGLQGSWSWNQGQHIETHSLFTFKVKVVPYYKNQKGTTTTLKVNVLFPVCITLSPSSMQTTGDFDNLLATTSQQHFWSSTLFLTSSTQGQPPITHQGLDTFFPNNQRLPAGHLGLCNWGLTWDITRENPHRHRKNIKNCTQKGIH